MPLNESHTLAANAQPIQEEVQVQPKIKLLRRRSVWNGVDFMVCMLRGLRRRLESLVPVAQVGLLLHVVLCHTHVRVILAAVTSQIIILFLGASVTASLQLVVACVSRALKWQRSHAYVRVVSERRGLRDTVLCLWSMLHTVS